MANEETPHAKSQDAARHDVNTDDIRSLVRFSNPAHPDAKPSFE